MKPSRLVLVIVLSLFAFHAATAQDTFVCGQTLVETGPDRWYYKDQPGGVTVMLIFENNMLEQIRNIPQ